MPGTFTIPAAWTKLYSFVSPPGFLSAGTAFLHERTTPEGEAMLVVIDFLGGGTHAPSALGFGPPVFQVRTFTRGRPYVIPAERESSKRSIGVRSAEDTGAASFRVFAGQPDPADPTHFTIRLDVDGTPRTLDGWLRNGGAVDLELRPAPTPATTPTTTPTTAPISGVRDMS